MEKPIYQFESTSDDHLYFFYSIGKNKILKVVSFGPFAESRELTELVFGNYSGPGKPIDVMSVDNNEDMEFVIGTVVTIVFDYLKKFPNEKIIFYGSTKSRTRLYRAAIAKTIEKIEPIYSILGLTENKTIEVFDKNRTYIAYLILRDNEK
jgi:hypothetical protein